MQKPIFFTVHYGQSSHPMSAVVATELKEKLGATTMVLSTMPNSESFEQIAGHTFPLVDGKVNSGRSWVRLPVVDETVPEFARRMKWYYKIDRKATASVEALERAILDIMQDAAMVVAAQSKKPLPEVIRTAASRDNRQSPR